jgi:hypothetical protein
VQDVQVQQYAMELRSQRSKIKEGGGGRARRHVTLVVVACRSFESGPGNVACGRHLPLGTVYSRCFFLSFCFVHFLVA